MYKVVKIKGFSTVEALIGSVLIGTAISITFMIVSNVMYSSSSLLHFQAKSQLYQQALLTNTDPSKLVFDQFEIRLNKSPYSLASDLSIITYIAIDREGKEIVRLNKIQKNQP